MAQMKMESNYSKNSAKKRTPRKSLLVGKLIVIAVFVIAMTIIVVKTYNDKVLIRIGNHVITEDQLETEYSQLPGFIASKVNRSTFLETFMIPHALLVEASKNVPDSFIDDRLQQYAKRFNLEEELKSLAISKKKFREILRIEIHLNETLFPQTTVTEEEILKVYQSEPTFLLDGKGSILPLEEVRDQIVRSIENEKLDRTLEEYVLSLYDEYAPEFKSTSPTSIDHRYRHLPVIAPWHPDVITDCFTFIDGISESCVL